ncbi:hypothetical protein [Enterovibrio paralichthyis]|uniref:hypothetical protein n=1 Tax=Enterovibrio paralichthyis TaxID=2853805 RepID=UPI001C47D256|nr:hypothetical protein [Enterovibrio paralichthyis]MBV7300254.1 hypothetical protein [Enterovibrio paralichthyis]
MYLMKGLIPVRCLTSEEKRLVSTPFTPGVELYNRQQDLLHKWRGEKLWLQCNCQGESKSQPVMSLRQLRSGMVCFALNPSSTRHARNCQFYRTQRERAFEDGQQLEAHKVKRNFCFHRERLVNDEDDDSESRSSSSSRPSMPGLQRFLYELTYAAKTDRFWPTTKLDESQYLWRLSKAATEFTLNGNFRLSDFLYFDVQDRRDALKLLADTGAQWIGSAKPHCLFVFPVDKAEKLGAGVNLIRYRYKGSDKSTEKLPLPKSCKLILPPGVKANEQNPCLAIVSFTDVSETDNPFYGPAKAVLVPVVSKSHLMIVKNDFERRVAKEFRRWQRHLSNLARTQYDVKISRPLVALHSTFSDLSFSPDFVVEHNNRKAILQVIDVSGSEAIEDRQSQYDVFDEVAPIIEFFALDAEQQDRFDEECEARVKHCLEVVLQDSEQWCSSRWDEKSYIEQVET